EISDAKTIRRSIMDSVETASFPGQRPEEIDRLLHFVIVGGGPTGVEYAAELGDFVDDDLKKWFPVISTRARITLIDSRRHVLASFDERLVEHTERAFRKEHIEHLGNTRVKEVREKEVVVSEKRHKQVKELVDGVETLVDKEVVETYSIPYGVLVWAGGNGIRPITQKIISKLDPTLQKDRYGFERLLFFQLSSVPVLTCGATPSRGLSVDERLKVLGTERMYAMGDCTATKYAPTAQVASQQAQYLASTFAHLGHTIADLSRRGSTFESACEAAELAGNGKEGKRGEAEVGAFGYRNLGSLAYVGGDEAIADLPFGVKLSGAATYWFWKSVYLS
ncbi:NADH:ubiquinone oxidoreductase, partial [Gonapodya sp. JEL0774]